MARMSRLKFEGEGVYHLYAKAACSKGEFPFERQHAQRKLIEMIKFYAKAYECEVYAYTIMGNHYHMVVRFVEERKLSEKELHEKIKCFYPNTWDQARFWSTDQKERFTKRIFNVSEFMRSIQSAYGRWYNRQFERKGAFWAERFKSTLLLHEKSVYECMQYIELNPIRAGIVKSQKPEDYVHSSLHQRCIGKGKWLKPLKEILNEKKEKNALKEYKAAIYYRGGVQTKPKQKEIPLQIILEEEKCGFSTSGKFLKQCRYFKDGLALGLSEQIEACLQSLKEQKHYKRRVSPIPIQGSDAFTLREQRKNYIRI